MRRQGGCLGTLLGVLVCIAGCASSSPGATRTDRSARNPPEATRTEKFARTSPEATRSGRPARNLIIFIADGLRHDSVNATDAPTLLRARTLGVHFLNSHSLFPTLTTANAAAIATSHYLGDTGIFSNTEYSGVPVFTGNSFRNRSGTATPFLEDDRVLADLDDRYPDGNFIGAQSLLALAREHGMSTAAIGKLGPVAIQDLTQIAGQGGHSRAPQTVVLDDSTGSPVGVPVSSATAAALSEAGLPPAPPRRRQPSGTVALAGTLQTNTAQQQWLVDATTRAVLPAFVRSGKPFVLLYWSRDPDGTQHNQGDSLNRLVPGINGQTSHAAVANADANLKQILDFLDANPQVRAVTDVLITSDHGFATISKHQLDAQGHSTTSYSTTFTYRGADGQPEVTPGWLPPGFLAIDLAHALSLSLFDSDAPQHAEGVMRYVPVDPARPTSPVSRQRPTLGSGLLGGAEVQSGAAPKVVVAANGGSDLIYVPDGDRARVATLVTFLLSQDYTGAVFTDSALGSFPGTLPLSAIGLEGTARMLRPAIVVAFRTFVGEPGNLLSAVQIADTTLQEGQGSHGSFGRDNTFNNMAAFGPDFKQDFRDTLPVSNADIAVTAAHLLGLTLPSKGPLQGRVMMEALQETTHAPAHRAAEQTAVSAADATGKATVLQFQQLDGRRYFDTACRVNVPAADLDGGEQRQRTVPRPVRCE